MEDLVLNNAKSLISRDLEMEAIPEELTEEALLEVLADQVAYWIEYKLEFLLSLMYRLDIAEHKVNFALSPMCQEPANIALAKLILDRQKRRAQTKLDYKQPDIDGWEPF